MNPDLAPPGQPSRPAEPLIVGARAPAPARRVGVVGAGPAGLECALTLARAGDCEVVVWERETDVGGALAVAAARPASPGLARVARLLPRRAAGGGGDAAPRSGSHGPGSAGVRRGRRSVRRRRGAAGWSATPASRSTSSEALTAGPERLRGAAHLVVVDDGFGWWPSVSAVELGVAAGVERITLVDSRRRLRHGHPGREPHPAYPAARGGPARHPPADLARGLSRTARSRCGRRRRRWSASRPTQSSWSANGARATGPRSSPTFRAPSSSATRSCRAGSRTPSPRAARRSPRACVRRR